MTDVKPIYRDGFEGVEKFSRRYRTPYAAPEDVLPSSDADLDLIANRIVSAISDAPRQRDGSLAEKRDALTRDFDGKSELLLLHAVVIAVLRRDDPRKDAEVLFHRIWSEHGDLVSRELSTRWLISAATTFSTHGRTEVQRRAGLAITTLFAMLKLSESERLFTGLAPRLVHGPNPMIRQALPMGLPPYRLLGGELDQLMLYDVFSAAKGDPVMERLGGELFDRINRSENTLFRRLAKLRHLEHQKREVRSLKQRKAEMENSLPGRLSRFFQRRRPGQGPGQDD